MRTAACVVLLPAFLALALPGGAAAQECDKPNMLIVLDASGSMSGQKWTDAKNAVQFILNNYGTTIRWGLMLFAADSNCAAGTVNVGMGDNTSTAIMNSINARSPNSNTPTADTLRAANQYTGLHDPARLNYVMLITDGDPTCANNTVATATNASAGLFAAGIRTFVIGMPGATEANLLLFAQAGGTTSHYMTSNQASLQTAMTTIAQIATQRPCQNPCGTGTETCDLATKKWANCTAPTNCCTTTDEPCDTGKLGTCAIGKMQCVNAVLTCVQTSQPGTEQCDGIDNDCNGSPDDNIAPQACTNSCGKPGNQYCVNGTWSTCDAPPCCTDTNAPCNTGHLGICADGSMKCVNGTLTCVQTSQPQPGETCNGLDDNCDGQVDEGDPGGGAQCGTGMLGACATGHLHCRGGLVTCVPDINPMPETCNGLDDDCDGTPDNGNPGGGSVCDTGKKGECKYGVTACQGGILACAQTKQPGTETCNGLDDNCDGQVDEGDPGGGAQCVTGLLGECAIGHVHCRGGKLSCVPDKQPSAELCDGLDNDCDGTVDNGNPGGAAACDTGLKGECAFGLSRCENGAIACGQINQPSQEKCDGLDNDCDGVTDNGNPGGGKLCPTGKKGDCAEGHTRCEGGQIVCAQDAQPSAETCDGKDNDCDGVVDNGDPGAGGSCDTGRFGECGAGTLHCKGGSLQCTANRQPEPEKCDKLDNDCDGLVDNGNPGGGKLCATGKPGICAVGHTKCEDGAVICVPDHEAVAEVCNGIDDDCDGVIDNGVTNSCGYCGPAPIEACNGRDDDCNNKIDDNAECPPGKFCVNGDCVANCLNNECPFGLTCKSNYCVPACNGVTCQPDENCDNGICSNFCANITCKTGQTCRHGECLVDDCYQIGCLAGDICRDKKCVEDPCAAKDCDASNGEFCREGTCVASCATVSCAFGERCIDGACAGDLCFAVTCDPDQACIDGQCGDDPCREVACGAGRVCAGGHCKDDPCIGVTCPRPGEICHLGQCYSPSQEIDAGTPDAGGGGDTGGAEAEETDGELDGGTGGDVPATGLDGSRDTGPHSGADRGGSPGDEDGGSGIVHTTTGGGDDGAGDPSGCSCTTLKL